MGVGVDGHRDVLGRAGRRASGGTSGGLERAPEVVEVSGGAPVSPQKFSRSWAGLRGGPKSSRSLGLSSGEARPGSQSLRVGSGQFRHSWSGRGGHSGELHFSCLASAGGGGEPWPSCPAFLSGGRQGSRSGKSKFAGSRHRGQSLSASCSQQPLVCQHSIGHEVS